MFNDPRSHEADDLARDRANALLANYSETPNSCLELDLPPLIDAFEVLADWRRRSRVPVA